MDWVLATIALAMLGFAAISGRLAGAGHRGDGLHRRRPPRRLRGARARRAGAVGRRRSSSSPRRPRSCSSPTRPGSTSAPCAGSSRCRLACWDRPPADARRGLRRRPRRVPGAGVGRGAPPRGHPCAHGRRPRPGGCDVDALAQPRPPGLNVESGLNDGICVPLFWIVLAIAQAEAGAIGDGAAFRLVVEQIGYGLLAGVAAGALAAAVVVIAGRHGSSRVGCKSFPSPGPPWPSGSPTRSAAPASSPRSSAASSSASSAARGARSAT